MKRLLKTNIGGNVTEKVNVRNGWDLFSQLFFPSFLFLYIMGNRFADRIQRYCRFSLLTQGIKQGLSVRLAPDCCPFLLSPLFLSGSSHAIGFISRDISPRGVSSTIPSGLHSVFPNSYPTLIITGCHTATPHSSLLTLT